MEALKDILIALGCGLLVIGGIEAIKFLIKGVSAEVGKLEITDVRADLEVMRGELTALRAERQERRDWSNKQIAELQAEVEILKALTAARADGADDAVFGAWVDRATFDGLLARVQRLEEREAAITVGLMKTCDFALPDGEEDEDDLDTIEDGDEDGEA